MAPPGKYDGSIYAAAAMRAVVTIAVATSRYQLLTSRPDKAMLGNVFIQKMIFELNDL